MTSPSNSPFAARHAAVRHALDERNTDALMVSVGPDLPWLCGYEAMPLERLTMLVIPRDGEAVLVVPRLEAPRVRPRDEFRILPWDEHEDPTALVAGLVPEAQSIAVGDRTWARFLIELHGHLPEAAMSRGNAITGPLRAVKDADEVEMLVRAGAAADRVAMALVSGQIPLLGRTEADVSAELSRRLIDEGHVRCNFAIVAAGENAASPHHEPGARTIGPNEVVLCDIGGTMLDPHGVGYCSDITRCVWTGQPPEDAAEVWDVLGTAHAAAIAAARVDAACEDVDAAARNVLDAAGLAEFFVHRTGHGIGVEEHEDPYMVAGNDEKIVAGHAFSVEPGVYFPERWGYRLEDCLVATDSIPVVLTECPRALATVET